MEWEAPIKIVSYTALLYGREYLGYAIRSVIDHVDQHVILYCPHGSHGTQVDIPCPESRDELYAIAQRAAGDKLLWIDGDWTHENQQRESIYQYAPDADVILTVDADEIWPETVIKMATAWESVRKVRIPIIHFWRSFWRGIIHDPAYPERFTYPQRADGETTQGHVNGFICHMGYAQPSAIVDYKLRIHGHRNELRDVDWYMRERFLPNAQQDCHPVGSEWWNPEPINPLDYLPEWMAEHPYFNRQVIE